MFVLLHGSIKRIISDRYVGILFELRVVYKHAGK